MKWDVDIQYYLKSPVDGREFLSKAKLRRCKNRRRPNEGPFFTHISNENLISGMPFVGRFIVQSVMYITKRRYLDLEPVGRFTL